MTPFQAFIILILMPIGFFGWLYVYYSIARFLHFRKSQAEADRVFSESVDQLAIDLPRKNFCHRRIVAEWFNEWLGASVPEVGKRDAIVQGGLFGAGGDRL